MAARMALADLPLSVFLTEALIMDISFSCRGADPATHDAGGEQDAAHAADVIAKGGHALNPRGEFYTTETVRLGKG